MENLPTDIALDILSRLPAESVLQCKQVCKTWRTLLHRITSSTYFRDMHLRRQLLQFDDDINGDDQVKYQNLYYEANSASSKVAAGLGLLFLIGFGMGSGAERYHVRLYYHNKPIDDQLSSYKKLTTRINHHAIKNMYSNTIVGSCNGLVCFVIPHHGILDPIYICNPITGEYINLPTFHKKNSISNLLASGFGYNPRTNEYKVVRIYYPHHLEFPGEEFPGEVQVYTLGGGCGWRKLGETTHNVGIPPGVLANGALHWMDWRQLKIVVFDLADEEFSLLPLPPSFNPGFVYATHQLQVLGGCLSIFGQVRDCVDIWLLKRKKNSSYDMEKQQERHSSSWSKEFSIQLKSCDIFDRYEPFALTKTNEVLLWLNGSILYCYDPKTATLKKLWDNDKGLDACQAILHTNTFVSLKDMGESLREEDIGSQQLEYESQQVI